MPNIAFIGLGTMGSPMAKRLINSGFKLSIFDISKNALSKFEKDNVKISSSPKEAATDADFLITMLPKSNDVKEAILGLNGAVQSLKENSLVIEMSTIYPSVTNNIFEKLKSKNIHFIDAPVGRTPRDAASGDLLIIAGGEKKDIDHARPVLKVLGNEIIHVGDVCLSLIHI